MIIPWNKKIMCFLTSVSYERLRNFDQEFWYSWWSNKVLVLVKQNPTEQMSEWINWTGLHSTPLCYCWCISVECVFILNGKSRSLIPLLQVITLFQHPGPVNLCLLCRPFLNEDGVFRVPGGQFSVQLVLSLTYNVDGQTIGDGVSRSGLRRRIFVRVRKPVLLATWLFYLMSRIKSFSCFYRLE